MALHRSETNEGHMYEVLEQATDQLKARPIDSIQEPGILRV